MGKTRVGLQAAAELLEEFEDGAYFVELATIDDPALVAPTIGRALAVAETGEKPPEETLKGYQQEKEVLLLLDNFEQVLEATSLLDGLLGAVRGLKVMVTSRTVLRLYGEHEFPVPPSSCPTHGAFLRQSTLAGALSYFWLYRGHLSEGMRWLQPALRRSSKVPPSVRAKALRAAGAIANYQGDEERSESFLEESVALYKELGDKWGLARAYNNLGNTAARALINEAAWEAAWEEGQAMTWEAAISYALEGAEE